MVNQYQKTIFQGKHITRGKKDHFMRMENTLVAARGGGWAKCMKRVKSTTSGYKINKSWDVMYNMVTILNNTVSIFESC